MPNTCIWRRIYQLFPFVGSYAHAQFRVRILCVCKLGLLSFNKKYDKLEKLHHIDLYFKERIMDDAIDYLKQD